MADVLTEDQIRERFRDEWVLLGDAVVDETKNTMGGIVLFHSKDRDEVYQRAIDLREAQDASAAEIGVLFAGDPPEDMIFAL